MEPSSGDLLAFRRFADAFDAENFDAGRVHSSEEVEPGVYSWPWWEESPIVGEWHQALYDNHVIDPESDYLSEDFAAKMRQFEVAPALLDGADLQTIRTVLTNISRGDRFCDGYMASMFENGVAQAATRRLVGLASAPGNKVERTEPA